MSTHPAAPSSAPALLGAVVLGALCGIGGESLLFVRAQCLRAEALFSDDFVVLAFLKGDLPDSKGKILEERIRALPDVAEARFVSRDAAMRSLGEQDPELLRSVASLGESPINPVIEIRPKPDAVATLPSWIGQVSKLPEVADARFKPLELGAVLQAQFYRRLLDLALSLLACVWFLGAAAGLRAAARSRGASWATAGRRIGAAVLAIAGGMGIVFAAASPLRASASWWSWPTAAAQASLVLAGIAGATLIPAAIRHPARPRRARSRVLPAPGGDGPPADPRKDGGDSADDLERLAFEEIGAAE